MTTLLEYFLANPLETAGGFLSLLLVWAMVCLPMAFGVLYLFYFLLTLPMRRNERTRLFLDLLELGLKDGRAPEATVLEAAASRDTAMGVRFHLLAAHLQTGLRFTEALDKVPRLLPPSVRAMLQAGERIGDLAKVLPACRQTLRDGVSQARGALNYLVILTFCITPFTVIVPIIIGVYVVPRYQEVFAAMADSPLPAFTQFVFALSHSGYIFLVQGGVMGLLWLAILGYVGGPRLHAWLHRLLPRVTDGLLGRLPWRRKRLQRDFSAMLAVLLDASVPEAEAVTLAAESTGNSIFTRRAAQVRQLLNDGMKLPDALRALDHSGELKWRLANALQGRGGFLRALGGWHEALDARAFQLEQTAAQTATTVFVLFNGVIVAAVMLAAFLALIQLIQHALLW